jgi:thioredoxin reductase (NADPH)
MRELCESGAMRFVAGQIVGFEEAQGTLTHLQVMGPDDRTQAVPVDSLLPFLGLSPKLGPIAQWGLALERKQLVVDTEKFETSEPGIFAVGDVNTYPGKKKLIVCGFHEATLAAYAACAYVFPDEKVQLQYTTTSPRLHQLLGVTPAPD